MPSFRQRLASWISGPKQKRSVRMYQGARQTRMTVGFGSSGNSSADSELSTSLTQLRARSRQVLRDSNYAKRACKLIVNNVVGSGIAIQAQVMTTRKTAAETVNAGIEKAWDEWCCAEYNHTGGSLHFYDLERAALGQVFTAGEVFIRLHPQAFGRSPVPLALELIESERLPDGIGVPGVNSPGTEIRLGIEVDERFGRPVAYWIREKHPGDISGRVGVSEARYERVPADQIIHLRIINRWPQTRGEPWLHTALVKLNDMNEYSALEVQAARANAAYFATIETPNEESPIANDQEENAKPVVDIEPGTVQELAPGEELKFHSPTRPNQGLDPFMRAMLREVSSGVDLPYESVSGDYSQTNYSSSRLGMLDARDSWGTLQQWWVRSFRAPLHKVFIRQAVMAGAIPEIPVAQYATDMAKFEAVKFKLRKGQWIDPQKEVAAFKEARKAGFISTSSIIDQTGGGQDVEDVIAEIAREDALFAASGIKRDTEVPEPVAEPKEPKAETEEPADRGYGRVVQMPRGLQ
jgi:lambda family phage portal protein